MCSRAARPTAASAAARLAARRGYGIPHCCDELAQKAVALVCQKLLAHPPAAEPPCSCRPCFGSVRALLNLHLKKQGRVSGARGIKSKGFDTLLSARRKMSCRL